MICESIQTHFYKMETCGGGWAGAEVSIAKPQLKTNFHCNYNGI